MQAYDIEMLTRSADRARDHGWCFGLPPGISPQQWPLDPANGYPLMHVFTLLLPEDYRVHGPEIVALSLFATAPDHNDGGPCCVDGIAELVEAASPERPSDPDLVPFWQARLKQHKRLFRMKDILDCSYAVILLTQQEFNGPPCMPEPIADNRLLTMAPRPAWLDRGAAAALWETTFSIHTKLPVEDYYLYKIFGGLPPQDLTFNRALQWSGRANDPNAGKAPRASWSSQATGYRSHFYWLDGNIKTENYREHDWAKDHKRNHIGGTMRPCQNIPAFSPFYIEFEEYFGGCNFGGGNAQLDFRDMKLDWACG
jgi:hypothetical protein